MNDGTNVATLPIEPAKLYWNDREVEPRNISVKVQREANNHQKAGDADAMLLHVMAHSLHDKETNKRVFKSVDQIREDTHQRDYYKLMALAVACVRFNSPDPGDLPDALRAEIEANNAGPK